MKSDIAIITVSRIRNEQERTVVLETMEALSRLHLPIVIVDQGSPPEALQLISQMQNVKLISNTGTFTERIKLTNREGSQIADNLFFLQSDKLDFCQNTVPKMVERYRMIQNKGMLIPSRSHSTMQAYPKYQRINEEYLNFFISDYIGIEEDYVAGPRIYPANLVKYLDKLQEDIGWAISESYLYVIAKRLNMPFDFMSFEMSPPKDVDDEKTTKLYRMQITDWEIRGFMKGLEVAL